MCLTLLNGVDIVIDLASTEAHPGHKIDIRCATDQYNNMAIKVAIIMNSPTCIINGMIFSMPE